MSPLAQNRCRAIFGEDADEWRPERWIAGEGNSAERIKEMDKNLATVSNSLDAFLTVQILTMETVWLRLSNMCGAESGDI
jgi:hypothetical protein